MTTKHLRSLGLAAAVALGMILASSATHADWHGGGGGWHGHDGGWHGGEGWHGGGWHGGGWGPGITFGFVPPYYYPPPAYYYPPPVYYPPPYYAPPYPYGYAPGY